MSNRLQFYTHGRGFAQKNTLRRGIAYEIAALKRKNRSNEVGFVDKSHKEAYNIVASATVAYATEIHRIRAEEKSARR